MAQEFLCLSCGHLGKPRLRNRGSSFLEVVLWLSLVAPGILYTMWRMFRKERQCKNCNAPNPIPADSPMAQRLLNPAPPPASTPQDRVGTSPYLQRGFGRQQSRG